MQKDEEVGKVAQATPIVISLELFVDEAARVTVARGPKKVEAYHLKHAIETTEILDFLKELVEGVLDPSPAALFHSTCQATPTASSRRKGKKAVANAANGGSDEGCSRAPPTKRRRRKKKEEVREEDGGAENGDRDEAMQDVAPPSRRDENWVAFLSLVCAMYDSDLIEL
ncbi:hypothetical protein BJV77DRAFT_1035027 [Russula vinacea]|nr:hypothetical protein BJV77DRAFT_1035027 [Russula vinacea]